MLVKIEALTEGMITARDITDRVGRVMVTATTKIQEKHLRALKIWGIKEVEIITATTNASLPIMTQEISAEQRARIEQELLERFCHNNLEHPLIKELFQRALQRQIHLSKMK